MRTSYILTILITTTLVLSSFSSFSCRKVHPKQQHAADFEFKDLNGVTRSLSDYEGKLVILNFWASWAAPCLREMPNLEKLNRNYRHMGLQVLGVAVVSRDEDINQKANQLGITYPVLLGDKEVIATYGSFADLPTTFVIDENGKILRQLSGSNDYRSWEKIILPLLSDPSLSNR